MVRAGGSAAPSSPQHHISSLLQHCHQGDRHRQHRQHCHHYIHSPQCCPCSSIPSSEWLAARAVSLRGTRIFLAARIHLRLLHPPSSVTPSPCPSPLLTSMGMIVNVSLIVMCTVFNVIPTNYFFLSQLLRQSSRPQGEHGQASIFALLPLAPRLSPTGAIIYMSWLLYAFLLFQKW